MPALAADPVVAEVLVVRVRRGGGAVVEHRLDDGAARAVAIRRVDGVLATEVAAEGRRTSVLRHARRARGVVGRVAEHLQLRVAQVASGRLHDHAVGIVLQHHQRSGIGVVELGAHVARNPVDRVERGRARAGSTE